MSHKNIPINHTRPEVLPEFEIYLDKGEKGYIKQQKCNQMGIKTNYPAVNHALIPLSEKEIVVKLPSHRVFFLITDTGFEEIEGMVQLPTVSSYYEAYHSYLKPGAIIEVDKGTIKKDACFRKTGDINPKYVPMGMDFLFLGQLCILRGANVVTIDYLHISPNDFNDHSFWPLLKKSSHLAPFWGSCEQAHLQIIKEDELKASYAGTRVLETASNIWYGNRFLVGR